MKLVKISIVGYTNTLPFRWALKRSEIFSDFHLSEDHPGDCARKLLEGTVDLALVPVAIIPALSNPKVVTDYCIGANGIVDSVKLYSEVPVESITEVLLDYQSRTSVALTRILFSEHWQRTPKFTTATPGFESRVEKTRATVVIGDRTFALNGRYKFEFDLAEEWKKFTGLPFVFAAWVTSGELDLKFLDAFNRTLAYGVNHIDRAVAEEPLTVSITRETVAEYLHHRIDYALDTRKREAMQLFFEYLKKIQSAF